MRFRSMTRKFLDAVVVSPEEHPSYLAEGGDESMQTVRLSKKTLDDLLQHSVWLQQELLEKQDKAEDEDEAVWCANRIYEIEKVKEQARLEALESM